MEAAASGSLKSRKSSRNGRPSAASTTPHRLVARKGRHPVLQRLEIPRRRDSDDVGAGGEELTEFHVRWAEPGQRGRQPRPRRRRLAASRQGGRSAGRPRPRAERRSDRRGRGRPRGPGRSRPAGSGRDERGSPSTAQIFHPEWMVTTPAVMGRWRDALEPGLLDHQGEGGRRWKPADRLRPGSGRIRRRR